MLSPNISLWHSKRVILDLISLEWLWHAAGVTIACGNHRVKLALHYWIGCGMQQLGKQLVAPTESNWHDITGLAVACSNCENSLWTDRVKLALYDWSGCDMQQV
jgi:hypothetical protein